MHAHRPARFALSALLLVCLFAACGDEQGSGVAPPPADTLEPDTSFDAPEPEPDAPAPEPDVPEPEPDIVEPDVTPDVPEPDIAEPDVAEPDVIEDVPDEDVEPDVDAEPPPEPNIVRVDLIPDRAIATWIGPLPEGDQRPVLVFTPGWSGSGAVNASISPLQRRMTLAGYVTLAIGFDSAAQWQSNIAESVHSGLDALCGSAEVPARCSTILLIGNSYGGIQNYWNIEHLRQHGYNIPGVRNAVGFVSVNAGYAPPGDLLDNATGAFNRTGLADAETYSVAMIENQGDMTFPIDACTWGNCGIRVLAQAHRDAAHANVLTICPEGGSHDTTTYDEWDAWIDAAVKYILHTLNMQPIFPGYLAPTVPVANDSR